MLADDEHFHVIETRVSSSLLDQVFAPAVDVVLIAGVDYSRLRLEHSSIVILSDALPDTANHREGVGGQVRAVLPMNATAAQISAALVAAAQDFYVLSRDQVQGREIGRGARFTDEPGKDSLTIREKQVLRMMSDGLGNKEIAKALGVSDHTAKFHVSQVLAKLHASSRAEAVRVGIRRGLIPI